MKEVKLLFVEDDDDFRELIKDSLELFGRYDMLTAKNGLDGYNAYKSFAPDIIVTDIEMPVMSGLDMIEKIRAEDSYIPIIISSEKADPKNTGKGYNLEIDKLIRKPFSPIELDYNIKALFLRIEKTKKINKEENKIYELGSYRFDIKNHCLIHNDIKKNLTIREVQILQLLCESNGDVVERKDILSLCWEKDDFFASRSLDVFITKLRKYFEKDKSISLSTERGIGFKFVF